MTRCEVTITNKLGLHARAAARLVQLASGFASDITVRRDSREVNAKSIMGVMMLAAGRGVEIEIAASGSDEQTAVAALRELVCNRFGEAE
ncbi:MAG: HPr family phosphocarrier protein [Gammaproteobacteria bacterium]